MYSNWQKIEENLKSKRDSKQKLETSNKLDKVPTVAAEIKDVNKYLILYLKNLV
jgi:hypothetical protein